MKVSEKYYREAGVWIGNLHGEIKNPSPEQAQEINEWLHNLNERLRDIQRILFSLRTFNQESPVNHVDRHGLNEPFLRSELDNHKTRV